MQLSRDAEPPAPSTKPALVTSTRVSGVGGGRHGRRRRQRRGVDGRAGGSWTVAVAFSIVLTDVRFDGICNGWAGGKSCSATPSHGRRNSYNSMELPAWNVGQQWEVVDSGSGGGCVCTPDSQAGRRQART